MAAIFDPGIFQNEAGSVGQKLFQSAIPAVVVEPETAEEAGGVGQAAWRDHYKPQREREARERRRLQAAAELLQRELEARECRAKEAARANELSEALLRADFESAMLRGQLNYIMRLLQEMDDEEAILLLSVH